MNRSLVLLVPTAFALVGCDAATEIAGDTLEAELRNGVVMQCEQVAEGAGVASARVAAVCQCSADKFVAEGVPAEAGLLQPGALYQSKHRVAFADTARDPEGVEEALTKAFPEAGFDIRTRDRASPGADRFVRQMSDFLTLVGLAALVIAGIGIAGGVSSYLDQRRASIATPASVIAVRRSCSRLSPARAESSRVIAVIAALEWVSTVAALLRPV